MNRLTEMTTLYKEIFLVKYWLRKFFGIETIIFLNKMEQGIEGRYVGTGGGRVLIKTAFLLFSASSLGTHIKGLNDMLDMTA